MANRKRPPYIEKDAKWSHRYGRWELDTYYFDEVSAQKAADFFPEHLRLTKGRWAGKPFVLEGWQENDIIKPIFGWKHKKTGFRRFKKVMIWVPRKNGKTELAAGVALLLLLGDAEYGGEIYNIASTKEQASICFDATSMMVGHSPTLKKSVDALKTAIYCPKLMASIKPLSGRPDGKHGLNVSGLVGDEVHEWKDDDLYQYVHDGEDARDQPLDFLISTAGKKGTVGEEFYEESKSLLSGEFEDFETLVVIYEADKDCDWKDEKVWAAANPNLNVSKSIDAMRRNAKRAMRLPRLENAFKNYQLNIWTDQAVRWLPIDSEDDNGKAFGWKYCAGPTPWDKLYEKMKGKLCYGGLDLSSTTDLTALVWYFPQQPDVPVPVLIPTFWKPRGLLRVHEKKDKLPYVRWEKEGALRATPGNVIDYDAIETKIAEDAEHFKIGHMHNYHRKPDEGGLAIDRWNATQTAVNLSKEGYPVVFFGQGFASMSAPSKQLERLVIANAIHHGAHPVLNAHAKAATVLQDAADNIKPTKEGAKFRIDGIPATVMAIGISARPGVGLENPWDDDEYSMTGEDNAA